ncbi:hypothetical protein GCM10007304_17830 [Rhodococcoides trifolii]|uniref:DUF1360 domain-containing protein n=1 Tax=Rhodococcoides trifolii TaxID=908250 RepID=A0A917FTP5_9NOCA|nr:hypothetical protein [Rhodococcus trifolii]GGG04136.1 hypothetical protein GCM10007304_17830 [Rhodococcus trifolii]
MTVTVFLLALGATARLTRLISDDYVTRYLRALVIRRRGADSDSAYLVTCPWCLSPYIGAAIFTTAWFYGEHPGFLIPAMVATASYIIGIAASWLDGDA